MLCPSDFDAFAWQPSTHFRVWVLDCGIIFRCKAMACFVARPWLSRQKGALKEVLCLLASGCGCYPLICVIADWWTEIERLKSYIKHSKV